MGKTEEHIAAKIVRLGLSRQAFAATIDISETFLSRGLSGVRPFAGPDITRIDRSLNDLLDIKSIIEPLSLPSDVATLKLLLNRYRDNGLAELRNIGALAELRLQLAGLQCI